MAENVYEGLFILDSNLYAQDPNGCAEHVAGLIEPYGGELLASRLWEERKLAYPIGQHKKGTYWLTYFKVDGSKITEIERASEISELVVRSLVIRLDERIVDVLVSHAQGLVPAGVPSFGGDDDDEEEIEVPSDLD